MAGATAVIAGVFWWKGSTASGWLAGIAALFLGAAFLWPASLDVVERLWMSFARLLQRVMTFLIVGMTFFLVITPLGLAMRLARKELIAKGFDARRETYWVNVAGDDTRSGPEKPY